MQQAIPNTTLCCIDCINHDLSIAALQTSMASLSFDRVLFITDRPFDIPGIETVLIPSLTSRDAYSAFVLHRLAGYIGTDHVLLMQWDGYVINPAAWRDEFLQYDYIGAIWGTVDDSYRVGNGGFSLRSKKLLSACRSIPLDGEPGNEDTLICRTHRPMLERDFGIRFAPELVAAQFAFELTYPEALPLGFHGLFNIWMVLAPADVRAYIESLPPNVVNSTQFLQLGINYRDLRQFAFAELVFRRIVAADPAHAEAARQLAALAKRPLPNRAIGRNEPCPCGSGQRYKNCCGLDGVPQVARGMSRDDDIQWLLGVAMHHQQQGRAVHAAAIYRLILAEQPDHALARQYLDVVA